MPPGGAAAGHRAPMSRGSDCSRRLRRETDCAELARLLGSSPEPGPRRTRTPAGVLLERSFFDGRWRCCLSSLWADDGLEQRRQADLAGDQLRTTALRPVWPLEG